MPPDEKVEFDSSVDYDEYYQQGLGIRFAEEVYTSIARIIKYPDAWSSLSRNSFRYLVNRFPYGAIYQIKHNTLRIIAIAHLNRWPGYWEKRLKQGNPFEEMKELK